MTRQHQSALSRLGFRDPDKENPRHGLACEYLQEKMRPYVAASMKSAYAKWINQIIEDANGLGFIEKTDFVSLPDEIKNAKGVSRYKAEDPSLLANAIRDFSNEMIPQFVGNDLDRVAELSSLISGPSSGAKGFLDVSFRGEAGDWHLTPEYLKGTFTRIYFTESWEGVVKTPDLSRKTMGRTRRSKRGYYSLGLQFSYWGEVRIEPTAPELLLQQIEFYSSNLDRNDMIWVLADFDLSDFKRMAQAQFPQLKCFQLGPNFEEWCKNRERPEIPEL